MLDKLKPKDIPVIREKLLKEQNSECKLCSRIITDGHLDHDHQTGFVRGVLCINCNLLEGMLLHKFNRSGLKQIIDYKQFLVRLLDYTSQQTDYIHPGHRTKQIKDFKKLTKPEMTKKLLQHGIKAEGTKLELVKQYRKVL